MRATLMLLVLGAATMSQAANADEPKKDGPVPKKPEDKYPLTFKVRVWDANGKKFLGERTVTLRRTTVADRPNDYCLNPANRSVNTTPTVGSELTDSDGTVWVSEKCTLHAGTGEYHLTLKKKP